MSTAGTVCVTGAAGYVGSWLVMKLLDRGYAVRAAVRDPGNAGKVKHLLELAGAEERLTLWKADLEDEGSYDEAVRGCDGVFHVASPVNLESEDPEVATSLSACINEVIRPAVAGTLNVLRSCSAAKTVRRVVFTSSTAAVLAHETRKSAYEDDSWSDVEFCRAKKMIGWMYFVSKTLAEQAAWDFAEKNQLDLVSIVPSLINGPFLTPSAPPSMLTALALFQRNERHYSIINPAQLVHLDDLCDAHIFLFENANAEGRYICASHHLTITELARMLRERYPELDVQAEFGGLKVHDVITLSSKKLTDLGFSYKYTLEDMYDGAIRSCREKGLLPAPEVKPSSAET